MKLAAQASVLGVLIDHDSYWVQQDEDYSTLIAALVDQAAVFRDRIDNRNYGSRVAAAVHDAKRLNGPDLKPR